MNPPAVRGGEGLDGLLDDAEQRPELLLGTVEVVGREQPEGDDLDPRLVAPRQEVRDVVGAGLVALGLVHHKRVKRNADAKVGDRLILGKPIGVPVI